MKPQIVKEVCNEIVAYMKLNDGKYSNWYCGIASDWASRLFKDHHVPIEGHPCTVRQCYTNDDAKAAEEALLELGCDGGVGGGDDTTVYVYAYLKGTMTNP